MSALRAPGASQRATRFACPRFQGACPRPVAGVAQQRFPSAVQECTRQRDVGHVAESARVASASSCWRLSVGRARLLHQNFGRMGCIIVPATHTAGVTRRLNQRFLGRMRPFHESRYLPSCTRKTDRCYGLVTPACRKSDGDKPRKSGHCSSSSQGCRISCTLAARCIVRVSSRCLA